MDITGRKYELKTSLSKFLRTCGSRKIPFLPQNWEIYFLWMESKGKQLLRIHVFSSLCLLHEHLGRLIHVQKK